MLYKQRMEMFGDLAVQMNGALKKQKELQDKKSKATKTCRLYEGKVVEALKPVVLTTLKQETTSALHEFLKTLDCYSEYRCKSEEAHGAGDERDPAVLQELEAKAELLKENCIKMIVRDYMNWCRAGRIASDMTTGTDALYTLEKLLGHPDFERNIYNASEWKMEYMEFVSGLKTRIESLMSIIKTNNSDLFEDMWKQSFFSIDRFHEERKNIMEDAGFTVSVENALNDPESCKYINAITVQNIKEYKTLKAYVEDVRAEGGEKSKKELEVDFGQFYVKHEGEIIDALFQLDENSRNHILSGSSVDIEQLQEVAEAKDTLKRITEEIDDVQKEISEIWDSYRSNYQMFHKSKERGGV